jgi:hypothetical protein
LYLNHLYIDSLIIFCYIKNHTIIFDVNMPNNPSSSFNPEWVYQFKVITNGNKPPVGYASETNLTFTLIETKFPAPLPSGISIANLNLTFKGSATTTYTMGKGNAMLKQTEIRKGFESDIRTWLSKCNIETAFNTVDFSKSTAVVITTDNNRSASSSTSISSDGISNNTSVNTGDDSSINNSTSLNKDGSVDFSAGTTFNGNETSISTSSDKPMTLVFKFSPRPLKGEYNQTRFEGTLELELDVTIYPIILINDKESSTRSDTVSNDGSAVVVGVAFTLIAGYAIFEFGPALLAFILARQATAG